MGCVSSAFLEDEDRIVGGPSLGHHIVSLTSTTYGLLTTLDQPPSQTPPTPPPPPPPPPTPPPPSAPSYTRRFLPTTLSEPEVINSWELMAGLDSITPTKTPLPPSPFPSPSSPGKENPHGSLRFSDPQRKFINSWELMAGLDSTTLTKPPLGPSPIPSPSSPGKENPHRSLRFSDPQRKFNVLRPLNAGQRPVRYLLEMFEKRCPPGGAQAAVLYTTTLRVVRKTFEDCNAVRAVVEGLGVWVRERDVSMDLGFREELEELMKGRGAQRPAVPRLFVKGRDIGGKEAVLRVHEEGGLVGLLEGLPRAPRGGGGGGVCDRCGGVRFLPCFQCSGSRKMVVAAVPVAEEKEGGKPGKGKVVRCPDCNENGCMLCPVCS